MQSAGRDEPEIVDQICYFSCEEYSTAYSVSEQLRFIVCISKNFVRHAQINTVKLFINLENILEKFVQVLQIEQTYIEAVKVSTTSSQIIRNYRTQSVSQIIRNYRTQSVYLPILLTDFQSYTFLLKYGEINYG